MADVDAAMMDRAFALGERARGRVSPNPHVGCVVVDPDGTVVGEGWTQPPGSDHAEIQALRSAGEGARGATAYVTLEPCGHTGRTPPCAEALVGAGVARVVHALSDPNPPAAGGVATLRAAGIDVVGDVAVERAQQVHEVFLHGLATRRPFVIWKCAMSLDGRTADQHGASQWITGADAREVVHRLRAEVDAVVVGSGTALADDPSLTVRLPGWDGHQPWRVVLDRRGRTAHAPLTMRDDGAGPVLTLNEANPAAVLDRLWAEGIRSVLLEGGAGVAGAFVAAGLVDRYELHYGGVLLGEGTGALATAFALTEAPRLRLVSARLCGNDVCATAYPERD